MVKNRDIFVTSTGVEIELVSIPPFEAQAVGDALKELHPIPPVPTYEVETVGGGKELHQHTEDTLTTPEDKAAWAAYTQAKEDAEKAINLGMNDYLFLAGIRYQMTDTDGAWMKLQKRFGVKIPDDPEDFKLHYLKTRLLSPDDLAELLPRLMRKTGVDEKSIQTAQNSFRGAVRRQRRQDAGAVNTEEGGQVVDESKISGDQNGEGLGTDA